VRARAGERNLTSSLTATDAITHAAVTGWTITAAQAVGLPATGAILVGFDVTDADALQHVIHGNGGIERPTPPVSGEPVQHIAASTEVKAYVRGNQCSTKRYIHCTTPYSTDNRCRAA